MKSIKDVEDILPITFIKAKYNSNNSNCENSKKISIKYLNSKMVIPQNFYKPISKITFCDFESK